MSPTCPDRDTLERFAFGFAEEKEATALRAHAGKCETCAKVLETLGKEEAALAAAAKGIRVERIRPKRRRSHRGLWVMLASAAACLAIGVWALMQFTLKPTGEERPAISKFGKRTLSAEPQCAPPSSMGLAPASVRELYSSPDRLEGEDLEKTELVFLPGDDSVASGDGRRLRTMTGEWAGIHRRGRGVDQRPEKPRLQPPPATQGTLRARDAEGKTIGEFPLKHTRVRAEISGYLGRTVVEQEYVNNFTTTIEAVYTFPLPTRAAVNDFVMEVGDRRIIGIVRPRAEAERLYREARARGYTASLLTQERPNIFTQNVANIEAGGSVTIKITYFEKLVYENGGYEYAFPMVVGPRYIPGSPTIPYDGPRKEDSGTAPGTDQVPDAGKITPPVMPPGMRSGHDIQLSLRLDAGLPITEVKSIAHEIAVTKSSPRVREIELARKKEILNRDFVLRWKVAGAETQFGVLAHRGKLGGFFTLMAQPPINPKDHQVMPREITFIMDVSGSMSGLPLDMSKDIVKRSLDKLRPEDIFNIVYFASGNGQLFPRPAANTPENILKARQFLATRRGGGGTEMLAGLRRALGAQHDPKHLQMYVFLTDGFIGNEEAIHATIKNERGDARFFAFGVGSSVNRHLIEGIGTFGGGESHVVLPREKAHADKAVKRFFDAIDSPVLVDISVDWSGLPVTDVYPRRIPDLFAGKTISFIGRFTGDAEGTAWITGRIGTRKVRYPVVVSLPKKEEANACLAPVWARHRIAEYMKEMVGASADLREELKQTVTNMGVEYRLVTQYTAFVAVDESRVVGGGAPVRIVQPVELPEGVSYEGVFGEKGIGGAVRINAWGMVLMMTESGKVRVAVVDPGSPAERAGIRPGQTLSQIGRTRISTLSQVDALLLQISGARVTVTLDGETILLPRP